MIKKAHLAILSNTRSVCRYSSRPSRQVRVYKIAEFLKVPVNQRCTECDQYHTDRKVTA